MGINEKIEKMTEGSKLSWESMKNELKSVNEVQSRSLGKKKLNNLISNENQPTSASEDALARYQNDLDDGDELPGLNNDEIADRDELVEGVSQATSENVFESLCATNNAEAIKEDIFNDFGSSSDSDDEKPEAQTEK